MILACPCGQWSREVDANAVKAITRELAQHAREHLERHEPVPAPVVRDSQ